MEEDSDKRRIKSLEHSLDIIRFIQDNGGASLAELDSNIPLSKGSIHTHLDTLRRRGFVTQHDRTYWLGLQFISLGENVKNGLALYQEGYRHVDDLADRTKEQTDLFIEVNGMGCLIYGAQGENASLSEDYQRNHQGRPISLHCLAAGKSILSQMSDERIRSIIDQHGLPSLTPNTVTDPDELIAEIREVRDQGFAINDEEDILGMRAVGAPIHDEIDGIHAGISTTVPKSRLQDEEFTERYPELLMQSANLIEINLEARKPSLSSV